ncbi:GNAT family N-acetyltransferase [Parerythrobacter aestuarii]|uniref:GNAT family N-acetyltransferase n=1 Tax=Parerythrobacter aestuarii TaxID=3020909 RepID=UPI0024DE0B42|nr:GNAT family N-acetyltransferase [Parerythrobacter aestuarii]
MTRHEDGLLAQAGQEGPRLMVQPWRAAHVLDNRWDWLELADRATSPNPFFERWAMLPALENFASDHPVRLLTLYDGDTLVGLMPLALSRDYYGKVIPHVSCWLHQNAFCGVPLVASGYEIAFWSAVLDWADAEGKGAPFLHLAKQPTDGPLYTALRNVLALQQRPACVVQQEDRALLASDLSAEEYFMQSMSTKKRKELRRQHKRLSEEGELRFHRSRGGEDIEAWIEAYLWLEKAGWKGTQGTSLADDHGTTEFFRTAIAGAADAGKLERLTMTLDGRPIAMLANFLTPPGGFSFKTTFDEDYARFSPGVLLQRENLELLANPVIDWVDSCAAADHPMIERIWREKRRIVSLNIALGGPLRRNAMRILARLETGSFPKGLD